MGLTYSTTTPIHEEYQPLFSKFSEFPDDIIYVILSHTTNRLSHLCLVNKYFRLKCKQPRIDMKYKDYIYYKLTNEDINIMRNQYDGGRIFYPSSQYGEPREVTHILKHPNIRMNHGEIMVGVIFYIKTNGYLCRLKRCERNGVEYVTATEEEVNMFIRKVKHIYPNFDFQDVFI
jgi:hypothetical protein